MTPDLSSRTLLVCITGGIAAYKTCQIVSRLVQRGAAVHVAMTHAATHFVGPTTFQALTSNPVATSLWTPSTPDTQHSAPSTQHSEGGGTQNSVSHIHLAQTADLILVAPATADILAKMAHGLADDLVSTLLLAAHPSRILVAPAMNQAMWTHPATQRNLTQLLADGISAVGPSSGWQACRTIGPGRMAEPTEILEALTQKLAHLPK